MRTAEQVKKEITKKYNRDPDGWKAWYSVDEDRNIEWMINRDKELWMIKEFRVNPLKVIGVGGRTKISGPKTMLQRSIMGFGVRPIKERSALNILLEEDPYTRGRLVGNLLLKINPIPLTKLREDYILHGPYLNKPKNLEDLSYKQRRLQAKLNAEIKKIKKRDFSYLYSLYQ